jgi:hypothetical protein
VTGTDRVLAPEPLLVADESERDGYVPNATVELSQLPAELTR